MANLICKWLTTTVLCSVLNSMVHAQPDSGFIKCNLNFKKFVSSVDSPGVSFKVFDDNFSRMRGKWRNCISNYRVPNFTAITTTGHSLNFDAIPAKVIVLNFWSVHCPPCQEERLTIDTVQNIFQNQDVFFISICFENRRILSTRNPPKLTAIVDGSAIFDLYGVLAFPTCFVISKKRKIIAEPQEVSDFDTSLKTQLVAMISGALLE